MRAGVHLLCVHEFPSVVGPPRHECDFALMFRSDWTPDHLQGGETNLYKEIALALKGAEWRKPGFVALASKLGVGVNLQAGHSEDKQKNRARVHVADKKAAKVTVKTEQGDLNA